MDSPVGVLEDYFKSSESETSSSKEHTMDDSESNSKPGSSSRWHAFLQLLRTRTKKPISTLHPLSGFKLSRRMSCSMRETILPSCSIAVDSSLNRSSPWKIFTHHEIQIATNYFSQGMQGALELELLWMIFSMSTYVVFKPT